MLSRDCVPSAGQDGGARGSPPGVRVGVISVCVSFIDSAPLSAEPPQIPTASARAPGAWRRGSVCVAGGAIELVLGVAAAVRWSLSECVQTLNGFYRGTLHNPS